MARLVISESFGTNPVTREDGARLRHLIEQYWSDENTLVLDFAGLRIASVSFFDESLGVLATKYPVEQLTQRVKVENIDPQDRQLLNGIVLSRAKERQAS